MHFNRCAYCAGRIIGQPEGRRFHISSIGWGLATGLVTWLVATLLLVHG